MGRGSLVSPDSCKCLEVWDDAVLTEIFVLQAETLVLLGEGHINDQYSDGV